MSHTDTDISALIASRICHDLISPIGAVSNGMELLELSGAPKTGEMALVSDSAQNAAARIRYFRLAFGTAGPDQTIAAEEMAELLPLVFSTGRVELSVIASGALPRAEAKAVLLAVMCAEQACPGRGQISVRLADRRWRISAKAENLNLDTGLWGGLQSTQPKTEVPPAAVQFILLPGAIAQINRHIDLDITDHMVRIAF